MLVKLADPGLSLRTEAEALDACEAATHFSVPRCLFRSADGDALGIEWIPHAPTLWNLRHRRKYPKALARRLGEAVAELHAGALPIPRVQSSFDFGADLLWPTPDEYARSNPASLELLARVQQDPTAPGVLEWLSSRAHFADLARPLHGDLRQPNVLVTKQGRPVLIDWDQAGWGDPASDVGSLLGDYLTEYFVPTGGGLTLPKLRAFSGELLRAYLEHFEPDARLPEAIIGWAAVSLLRNASVMVLERGAMTREASHLVDAGLSVLAQPRSWLTGLTGVLA